MCLIIIKAGGEESCLEGQEAVWEKMEELYSDTRVQAPTFISSNPHRVHFLDDKTKAQRT